MNSRVSIVDYSNEHHPAIRSILEHIGWAEQYITASVHNADVFSHNSDIYGVYVIRNLNNGSEASLREGAHI